VAYPSGTAGGWLRPDWAALVLVAFAAVALIRFKQGVIRVIVACALAGWAWRSLYGG
jgi:chromate transporter